MAPSLRLALLANPRSGSGCEPEEYEQKLRDLGAEVSLHPLDRTAEAVSSAPDRLVVAGGDGSIARVAEAAGLAGVPLAVLPAGTANDFVRVMGLPGDVDGACAVAAYGHSATRAVNLARINGRPFVNVASAGLAVIAAQRAKPLKRLLGPLAYALGALRAGLSADPLTCEVRVDGAERFAGRAWQVIVASSGAFGAGATVETADPTDGRLVVALIEAGPRARLVLHAAGLRSGSALSQRGVRHFSGLEVEIALAAGTAFNVDGEVVEVGSARCSVEPAAFRLVVGAAEAITTD